MFIAKKFPFLTLKEVRIVRSAINLWFGVYITTKKSQEEVLQEVLMEAEEGEDIDEDDEVVSTLVTFVLLFFLLDVH